MLWLIPGDEVLSVGVVDFAKAHKRMHLVQIARDLHAQAVKLRDIGVNFHVHQVVLVLQTPQQAIQQVPALRIAVTAADGESTFAGLERAQELCGVQVGG